MDLYNPRAADRGGHCVACPGTPSIAEISKKLSKTNFHTAICRPTNLSFAQARPVHQSVAVQSARSTNKNGKTTMVLTLFSILISNEIPDQNVQGEPHILVTDHGAFACIDLDATGAPISAWSQILAWDHGVIVVTDEHNAWGCSEENLVGLDEADAEGTLAVVWAALGELRRLDLNCPQTCDDGT